jgi:hypothetical protein
MHAQHLKSSHRQTPNVGLGPPANEGAGSETRTGFEQAIAAKKKKVSPRSVKAPDIVAVISHARQADFAACRFADAAQSSAPVSL